MAGAIDLALIAPSDGFRDENTDWREPARLFSLWQSEVDMLVTGTERR